MNKKKCVLTTLLIIKINMSKNNLKYVKIIDIINYSSLKNTK